MELSDHNQGFFLEKLLRGGGGGGRNRDSRLRGGGGGGIHVSVYMHVLIMYKMIVQTSTTGTLHITLFAFTKKLFEMLKGGTKSSKGGECPPRPPKKP